MQISIPERVLLDKDFNEKLPVFVYSHGGNFHSGSSTMPLYEGRYLSSIGDIIVISVNYRMDVFGFLPVSNSWNNKESVGNFGLTDQQVALRFINEYIEHFGGDKNRVTMAGQSAGSESAYLNMLASDSPHQDYYQRVMLMSIPSLPYLTTQQAYENVMMAVWTVAYERYSNSAEHPEYKEFCDKNPGEIYENITYTNDEMNKCLYQLEARELWDVAQAAKGKFSDFQFIQDRVFQLFSLAQSYDPVIDGNILFDQDVQAAEKHLPLEKDIMVGSTGDEGEIFVDGVTAGLDFIPRPMPESTYRLALEAIWKVIDRDGPGGTAACNRFAPEITQKRCELFDKFYEIYPWDLDCARFHDQISFNSNDTEKEQFCDANDSGNHGVRDYLFTCSQRAWLKVASKRENEGQKGKDNKIGNRYFWYFDEPVPWIPPQGGML